MAGILKVDDLRGNTSAGDITITSEGGSATMQLQQGVIKSWVDLNGSTFGVNDSHNVSSATDNGAGNYHQNLTNNLSATQAGTAGSASSNVNYSDREVSVIPETTSHLQINCGQDYTVNRADATNCSTLMAGDLA